MVKPRRARRNNKRRNFKRRQPFRFFRLPNTFTRPWNGVTQTFDCVGDNTYRCYTIQGLFTELGSLIGQSDLSQYLIRIHWLQVYLLTAYSSVTIEPMSLIQSNADCKNHRPMRTVELNTATLSPAVFRYVYPRSHQLLELRYDNSGAVLFGRSAKSGVTLRVRVRITWRLSDDTKDTVETDVLVGTMTQMKILRSGGGNGDIASPPMSGLSTDFENIM